MDIADSRGERERGRGSESECLWSTESGKEGRVFFSSDEKIASHSQSREDKKKKKKKKRRILPLLLTPQAPSLCARWHVRPCYLPGHVCYLRGKQRSSKTKRNQEPMRVSLAALAQIGRLPTPPAAALEAVSSETKVRDFFREVRKVERGRDKGGTGEKGRQARRRLRSSRRRKKRRSTPLPLNLDLDLFSFSHLHPFSPPPPSPPPPPPSPTTDLPFRPLGRQELPPRGHDHPGRAPQQRRGFV